MGSHVIILGNGFDIYLNRPTKYSEFYDSEFCPKHYPAPLINYLNGFSEDGKAEKLRWYDFENHLLEYCESKFFKKEPLLYEEKEVIKYLQKQSSSFSRSDLQFTIRDRGLYDAFVPFSKKGFIKPDENGQKYVLAFDRFDDDVIKRDIYAFYLIKEGLISYLKTKANDEIDESKFPLKLLKEKNIEVYTFNYTTIPFVDKRSVNYVHGACADDNIIIGTREGQFNKDYWFLQKVFDPNYHPSNVSIALLNAERVTIFGHSLGVNDRQYFQAFFKRQCDAEKANKKMQINIYTYDDDSVKEIKHSLQELTDYHLSDLFQYSALQIITTKNSQEKL